MKAVVGQPVVTAGRRLTGEQDRAKPLYVVPLSLATMNTCRTPKWGYHGVKRGNHGVKRGYQLAQGSAAE